MYIFSIYVMCTKQIQFQVCLPLKYKMAHVNYQLADHFLNQLIRLQKTGIGMIFQGDLFRCCVMGPVV